MKILVTGAAGFIGSHLTETLVSNGHEVLALDALMPDLYPLERKVANWNRLQQLNENVKFLVSDLRLPVNPLDIEDCDYIFHLAAMPGLSLSWEETRLYIDCNVLATANLLKACDPKSLKKFFYISSSSVYGRKIAGDESSPISPISPYGVTKLAAESMVAAYSSSTGLKYSIFRPFSVYGPRQRDDMAFHIFIRKLLNNQEIQVFGDGSQSRTNTYVEDLVNGLISGINNAKNGEIYNLCGNEQFNVSQVIETLGRILNKTPKVIFGTERLGDQHETKGDSQNARTHLGYSPQISLEVGLTKQIEWQMTQ
jgi:UDP-glucuronate 4-epimerase